MTADCMESSSPLEYPCSRNSKRKSFLSYIKLQLSWQYLVYRSHQWQRTYIEMGFFVVILCCVRWLLPLVMLTGMWWCNGNFPSPLWLINLINNQLRISATCNNIFIYQDDSVRETIISYSTMIQYCVHTTGSRVLLVWDNPFYLFLIWPDFGHRW